MSIGRRLTVCAILAVVALNLTLVLGAASGLLLTTSQVASDLEGWVGTGLLVARIAVTIAVAAWGALNRLESSGALDGNRDL